VKSRAWVIVAVGWTTGACGAAATAPGAAAPDQPSVSSDPLVSSEPAAEPGPSNAPSLRVTHDGTSLDGQTPEASPEGKPQRLDDLFRRLKARDGGERFHPPYSLGVANDVSVAQLKSALETAAFSGWSSSLLGLDSGQVTLFAAVPLPRNAPKVSVVLGEHPLVLIVHADRVELRRAQVDPKNSDADAPTFVVATLGAAELDAKLPAVLQRECAQPDCSKSVLLASNDARFPIVRDVLKALARHAGTKMASIELRMPEPPALGAPLALPIESKRASARLAPELIQQLIRAHYPQIQDCYSEGLGRNAKLAGKVVMRFVIERDGRVRKVETDPSTTLPDQLVLSCVQGVFAKLRFAEPQGGIVTVVYPLALSARMRRR
jgi:hypothetical protein